MKTPRQKITTAQSHEILQAYLHLGSGPAGDLALGYGVSRHYGNSLANQLGLQPRRKIKGSGRLSNKVDHTDPRWARAIAIGPVSA